VTVAGGTASLVLEDIAAADLDVSWSGLDLVLRIRDTGDSITLRNHDPAHGGSVRTSDGMINLADLVPVAPLNLTV
jgi:Haemolysin-type calcium binding protein related domain